MPIINVSLIAGRPYDQRRRLMQALSDAAVATLGAPPESVRVLLTEISPEHWAVGGVPKAPPPEQEEGAA